ncbi:MAG: gliding motility lipoprotein GldH, partial [Christiangramia sp.]|nr:gliding motility lipoprotein GldH [Christiangramia sp.]
MRSAVFVSFMVSMIILLSSCDRKRVYDEYKPVIGWHKDSLVSFELGTMDSSKVYDLFINIRNNNDYQYSNLFLITEIKFPQGKVISDTLEYEMTKPDGEWLGTGFGDVKENKLWYKE